MVFFPKLLIRCIGIGRCISMCELLLLVSFVLDLPMNEKSKNGAKRDNDGKHGKLADIADNNRVHDLGAHLEFKRQRTRSAECYDNALGILLSDMSNCLNNCLYRSENDNTDTDQLKRMHGKLRNESKHGIVSVKKLFKKHVDSPF